ncbi:MAG: hypothetical protein Q9201_004359 [Fulgogasparrea decipioides]
MSYFSLAERPSDAEPVLKRCPSRAPGSQADEEALTTPVRIMTYITRSKYKNPQHFPAQCSGHPSTLSQFSGKRDAAEYTIKLNHLQHKKQDAIIR